MGVLTQEQLRWLIELDLEYVTMTKNKAKVTDVTGVTDATDVTDVTR